MGGAGASPYLGVVDSIAATQPVGLFLVGLKESFARSLARYVSDHSYVTLTGVAPSLSLATMLLPRTQADIALLDWAVLNGATRDTVQALQRDNFALCVVCVTNDAEAYRAAAMQAGADAVISKDGFAVELDLLLRGLFPDRFHASGRANE